MKIMLDNTEIDITPDTEKTWGDLLSALEGEIHKNGATIIEVCLDGKAIPAADFPALFEQPFSAAKQVALKTVTAAELALFFRETAGKYAGLCEKLANISAEFQGGRDKQVFETITELADSLDLFFSIVPFFKLFPERFGNFTINGEAANDFLREFSPVLDDFLKAFENRDIVLLGDLAEYEILPRLQALIDAGAAV